ncbi:MAG TPA: hypothetical protein VK845_04995 [Gemmatimonadales bacterium]|nr:hypothetical protein [Gemmatimonadales bacterium]
MMILVFSAVVTPAGLGAQEIDTVRVGSRALQGVQLKPGSIVMGSFTRNHGVETPTSTTTQHVTSGSRGTEKVYLIETVHASGDDDTTRSVIVVRTSDLSLMHHRVKAAHDSAAVTATSHYLTGWVVLPDEPVSVLDQQLDHPVFPIEGQVPWLFPLLPLAEGYAATIPHYSEWAGGEQWSTIRVLSSEMVRSGTESFECWKIDGGELFPGYRVTYWVDKRTRKIVQGVARGSGAGPEYWSRARP